MAVADDPRFSAAPNTAGPNTAGRNTAARNTADAARLHQPPTDGALPEWGPTLVLLMTRDPLLATRLDRVAARVASILDLRAGMVWAEVPNGGEFLRSLVAEFSDALGHIRVAFAAPGSTIDELLATALCAVDLSEVAATLEQARLAARPPVYEVRFQPVVDLSTRTVIGFESLLRASVSGEPVDTADLLGRAEEGGWLSDLDQLGRTLALRAISGLLGDGLLFLNVLAPGGIFDVDAVRSTVHHARERGLEPDQLVLEITERNRYPDLDAATTQIDELRALGVRLAIDDVGDGYASLLLVSRFRPDVVKISGRIIDELPGPHALAIVAAIVQLAHQTGTWVVAEGIEHPEQALALHRLGVDWGQGHLLGLPGLWDEAPLTGDRPLLVRR